MSGAPILLTPRHQSVPDLAAGLVVVEQALQG
jgi:hypothetical protein